MTKWTKGDPKPENWPEWLKKADISWCEVDIASSGHVTWRDGTWLNGIWENGSWRNGIWHNGTWVNGTWESGVWRVGTWENGTWQGGHWENGIWWGGTWRSGTWWGGTWRSGTWHSGIWRSGTWMDGTWNSGVWENGTWESGHQRKPRFGWSLDPDGLILGFDGGHWDSKTAEEWQPLLEGMPRDKVAEFRALLYWNSMLPPLNAKADTLWDHLQKDVD